MTYDISGDFYEACDCEAICSCWAEVAPDGGCTGLYAWRITEGTCDRVDVRDCKVVAVFFGKSCDEAQQILIFIDSGDGPSEPKFTALSTAIRLSTGPWFQVLNSTTTTTAPPTEVRAATVVIDSGASPTDVAITVTENSTLKAEAFCRFDQPITLTGSGNTLAAKVVGSNTEKAIKVGYVVTNTNGSGLNLLATMGAGINKYTFDLDISKVSAVGGQFTYAHP